MSHKIYHTEGLILSGINTREADRYLTIFTKDLGMVRAQAQGIRKLSSKLRYHLQDFYYSRINLVRGREIWRITNATKIKTFNTITRDPERFRILISVSRLIERLCPGEEKNEPLFHHLVQAFSFLDNEKLTEDEVKNLELIIVLRILYYLGYIGDMENIEAFTTWQFTKSLLEKTHPQRRDLVREINKALEESQL